MIYWQLFLSFFLIGALCYGGGYAAIPFVQDTVTTNGWMSTNEFLNMIAVAESTPGPVAINTATYVGFKLAGLSGAAMATFGFCLPAFIIVVALSAFLKTERGSKLLKKLMIGIKPVVVGMIFFASITIARAIFAQSGVSMTGAIDLVIIVVSFIAIRKFKANPILLIAVGAIIGIFIL